MSVTSSGSLQYDAKSGTVSCLGESARRTKDSEDIVTETLVFEHLTLTLSKEEGKQLVQGEQTLVILSGPDHGVELTRGEVQRGGVALGSVTYILDPLGPKIQEQCPVAVLREKLTLMRMTQAGRTGHTELQDPGKVDWKNISISPAAIIWQNSEVAIHLRRKVHLPPQCRATEDSTFFETNHESILASPDADPRFIDQVKTNPLDFLAMSNLAEGSRSDLVHTHIDSLLRNMSSQCSRMTLPSLTHYEIRYSGNGLKQSVFSGQIHQQVNFHSPRRAMIGRERTNSDGGVQVAVPVTAHQRESWVVGSASHGQYFVLRGAGWREHLVQHHDRILHRNLLWLFWRGLF